MAKITDEKRKEYADSTSEYQSKITKNLNDEKMLSLQSKQSTPNAPYKKIELATLMTYTATLYMAQNDLSLAILGVKNNDVLNDARKILYKAIIYLEDLVTNIIDMPYSELEKNYQAIEKYPMAKRFTIIKKLGLAIASLEEAFGDKSKWKWSFVELKGRFAVVAKNFIDMRRASKAYFDPASAEYETVVLYMRLLTKQLDEAAKNYRDKYELSTRRIDDMKNAIRFLLAKHKLSLALNDGKTAEEVKKKASIWKDKMINDQKSGLSK